MLQDVVYPLRLTRPKAAVTLLFKGQQQFRAVLPPLPLQVCQQVQVLPRPVAQISNDIVCRMCLDLPSADGRICMADAGEDKPQVIIYFRSCSNGRARILDIHLLLYCYCRRHAVDEFHVRFAHPAKELAGVRRKALCKTPLTFCKKSIESQRRFTGTGNAGNHHKLPPWNLNGYILEVVYVSSFYYDTSFCRHKFFLSGNTNIQKTSYFCEKSLR